MLDMYRKEIMSTLATPTGSISTFHYGQDISFEAFVQYKDYIGFVKAMDALRGMKLMYVEDADRILTATIKVIVCVFALIYGRCECNIVRRCCFMLTVNMSGCLGSVMLPACLSVRPVLLLLCVSV